MKKTVISIFIFFVCIFFFVNYKAYAMEYYEVSDRTFSYLNEDEYNLLLKSVMAEAGGETSECQYAVTEVILNRIDSTRFPNTLYDVIYSPGQFQIVRNGALDRAVPSQKVIDSVNLALKERSLPAEVLYFNSIDYFGWCIPYDKIDHMYFSSIATYSNILNSKRPINYCINEIVFEGDKEYVLALYDIISNIDKETVTYTDIFDTIGVNMEDNGYLQSIGDVQYDNEQLYFTIKTCTENTTHTDILDKLAEIFNLKYYYKSTELVNSYFVTNDENHKYFKYKYLLTIYDESLDLNQTKSLVDDDAVISYVNDTFSVSLETIDDVKEYLDALSKQDNVANLYIYVSK